MPVHLDLFYGFDGDWSEAAVAEKVAALDRLHEPDPEPAIIGGRRVNPSSPRKLGAGASAGLRLALGEVRNVVLALGAPQVSLVRDTDRDRLVPVDRVLGLHGSGNV